MMHDFTYQIININYIIGGPRHAWCIDVSCINKLIMQKPLICFINLRKPFALLVFDNFGNIIIGMVTLLNYYVQLFSAKFGRIRNLKYFMSLFFDWKPCFRIFNQSLLWFYNI